MIQYSDDKARLDVARIHGWLASSYWSPGIERQRVEKAIAHSHCIGAYGETGQIGFARMITDHATFAWLADVWVDESARGQGVGRAMVGWYLDRPDYAGLRRIMLGTADAHGVYAALGFVPIGRPERLMQRTDPAFAHFFEAPTP
jgi:GNAT superfamily N-acetyltransferase